MTSSARTMRRPLLGRIVAAAAGSSAASRSCMTGGSDGGELVLQPGADRGVRAREVELVDDGAHVEPRATHEQREDAGRAQPVDLGAGAPPVLRDGRRFPHVPQVEQVVRHAAALGEVGLRGADVHAAVQLHRVGVDHLAAQPLRQRHREGRLPGGRGSDDRHDGGGALTGDPVGDQVPDAEGRVVVVQPGGDVAAGERASHRPPGGHARGQQPLPRGRSREARASASPVASARATAASKGPAESSR